MTLPVVVGQDRNGGHVRAGVAASDHPTGPGTEPHHLEIVAGHDPGAHQLRLVQADHGERHRRELGHRLQARALLPVVRYLGDGEERIVDPGEIR